jgi:hypothetical protein
LHPIAMDWQRMQRCSGWLIGPFALNVFLFFESSLRLRPHICSQEGSLIKNYKEITESTARVLAIIYC